MRVRIYSPQVPWPSNEGATHVIAEQVGALTRLEHHIELVCWKGKTPDRSVPSEISIRWQPLAKRNRFTRIVQALFTGAATPELAYYPVSAPPHLAPVDLEIFHYSFAHAWLRTLPRSSARRVVVFHNLESDLSKLREREGGLGAPLHRWNATRLKRHEGELAQLVDELWFLSPLDLIEWKKRHSAETALLRFVPPCYSPTLWGKRIPGASAGVEVHGTVAGFIGGLAFGPNRESALWLLHELAPRLQVRGFKGELRIAGGDADSLIRAQARKFPFVRLQGYVSDTTAFWTGLSANLVPHVSGSGVRIKLLESLARGVPVLANPAAIERIAPALQAWPSLFISADADAWAERLCSLELFAQGERASHAGFPAPLSAEAIYSFL